MCIPIGIGGSVASILSRTHGVLVVKHHRDATLACALVIVVEQFEVGITFQSLTVWHGVDVTIDLATIAWCAWCCQYGVIGR